MMRWQIHTFQAVYRTSMRESSSCTLRVLEVILNLLELLIDMGILKQTSREELQTSPTRTDGETPKKSDKEKIPTSATHTSFGGESFTTDQNMSPHKLAMNTVVRYNSNLGLRNSLEYLIKCISRYKIIWLGVCAPICPAFERNSCNLGLEEAVKVKMPAKSVMVLHPPSFNFKMITNICPYVENHLIRPKHFYTVGKQIYDVKGY